MSDEEFVELGRIESTTSTTTSSSGTSHSTSADRSSRHAFGHEHRREAAGVDEDDVVGSRPTGRRTRCRAARRSPCRCTCGRAPSRRGGRPTRWRRRRTASGPRSRRRASGRRARRRPGRSCRPSRPVRSRAGRAPRPRGRRSLGGRRPRPWRPRSPRTGGSGVSPADRASARPATSPAWVPPLDEVSTTAAGVDAGDGALLDQLEVAVDVAERTGRRAPADRDRVRRGAVGDELARRAARGRSPVRPSGSVGSRRSGAGRRTARTAVGCPRSDRAGRPTTRGARRARARPPRLRSSGSGSTGRHRRSRATGLRRRAPRRRGTPACELCCRRRPAR